MKKRTTQAANYTDTQHRHTNTQTQTRKYDTSQTT